MPEPVKMSTLLPGGLEGLPVVVGDLRIGVVVVDADLGAGNVLDVLDDEIELAGARQSKGLVEALVDGADGHTVVTADAGVRVRVACAHHVQAYAGVLDGARSERSGQKKAADRYADGEEYRCRS